MAKIQRPNGDIDHWPPDARFALGDDGTIFVVGGEGDGDGREFAVYAPGHWARATNDPATD